MQLNKICLAAIVLFVLFTILKFVMKWSFKLFAIGIVICIILAIFGFFKGDDL
ncbi:hypothetical protein mru_0193 [Methanobrevibacter ruminantium M1]|uniref:Uncharacterized protein n=1 Tax=Methanobrevibacter ruminantium (strain ATCC 35063 / DSM 1093 / JCM 13430 / OCM 146 / M1) TaxID=634498 RepID=D3DZ90_METRM|nr:hypothetical protein [Methanobrevibacter ruminantium]ADC46045.1 hypothetical protein mru_0193 [Methanobrevibacter ruminantium M1]